MPTTSAMTTKTTTAAAASLHLLTQHLPPSLSQALTRILASTSTLLSTGIVQYLTRFLRRDLQTSPRSVFKWLFFALLILNARSLPLVWHYRVFQPVFAIHLKHKLILLTNILAFRSKEESERRVAEWFMGCIPMGENPLEMRDRFQGWASIDESDFNGHLSNSSYAKTLDCSRFRLALKLWPNFFRAGGWVPLAATHYHFLREIPMLARYEVRTSVVAWDEKWLYVLSRFVTYPKSKKGKKRTATTHSGTSRSEEDPDQRTFMHTSLRQAVSQTEISTPAPGLVGSSSAPSANGDEAGKKELDAVTAELLRSLQSSSSSSISSQARPSSHRGEMKLEEEEDSAITHTISISQVCFKIGRITVPPAIVMAVNGASGPAGHGHASTSTSTTSKKERRVPVYWDRVRAMAPRHGDTRGLREFMKGGWRNVPSREELLSQAQAFSLSDPPAPLDADTAATATSSFTTAGELLLQPSAEDELVLRKGRFWEVALGGEIEARRARNLVLVQKLRKGLEDAGGM